MATHLVRVRGREKAGRVTASKGEITVCSRDSGLRQIENIFRDICIYRTQPEHSATVQEIQDQIKKADRRWLIASQPWGLRVLSVRLLYISPIHTLYEFQMTFTISRDSLLPCANKIPILLALLAL